MLKRTSLNGSKNAPLVNKYRSLFSTQCLGSQSHSGQINKTEYGTKVGPLTLKRTMWNLT